MIQVRKAKDRGHANHGWLDTCHTFSFSKYQDPSHTRFRSLRVMNEDVVSPGEGFGTHPHHDMEIVTYVLEGALEHKDSMGKGEVLRPGEFQRMSAGTGITHSEFNPSSEEPIHLYQIWLFPERKGIEPSYEQKRFPADERHNRLRLVDSREAENGSLLIHHDRQHLSDECDRVSHGQRCWGLEHRQQASSRATWFLTGRPAKVRYCCPTDEPRSNGPDSGSPDLNVAQFSQIPN